MNNFGPIKIIVNRRKQVKVKSRQLSNTKHNDNDLNNNS